MRTCRDRVGVWRRAPDQRNVEHDEKRDRQAGGAKILLAEHDHDIDHQQQENHDDTDARQPIGFPIETTAERE